MKWWNKKEFAISLYIFFFVKFLCFIHFDVGLPLVKLVQITVKIVLFFILEKKNFFLHSKCWIAGCYIWFCILVVRGKFLFYLMMTDMRVAADVKINIWISLLIPDEPKCSYRQWMLNQRVNAMKNYFVPMDTCFHVNIKKRNIQYKFTILKYKKRRPLYCRIVKNFNYKIFPSMVCHFYYNTCEIQLCIANMYVVYVHVLMEFFRVYLHVYM